MPVSTAPVPPVVVATADSTLLDFVLAVSAAAGVVPSVVSEAGALRPVWTSAAMIVIGVDQASDVTAMVLPRRTEIYVVGGELTREELFASSVSLGAAVVVLPSGSNWLATAMADATGFRGGQGAVLAVVGGSGGVGATSLATALAFTGARLGQRSMVIDADPLGGGVDLLVGAEQLSGWRWPRLATASGHLGDLSGHLVRVEGVDILPIGRDGEQRTLPDSEPMRAVLLSASRSHDLVTVDVPRSLTGAGREVLRRAHHTLLVVHNDVRGVAAGRQVLRELDGTCSSVAVVVRRSPWHGLPPDATAEALGLVMVGSVSGEPALRQGAERGEPPGRSARSRLSRSCRIILDNLSLTQAAA